MFRLSLRPGTAMPMTMLFFPSEMTLPFFTSIFVKVSSGRIMPRIIANGTLTCS